MAAKVTNTRSNYVSGWTEKSAPSRPKVADLFWRRFSVSAAERTPPPTTTTNMVAVTWPTPHFRSSTSGRWRHRPLPVCGTVGSVAADTPKHCSTPCTRSTIRANMASLPEVTSERRLRTTTWVDEVTAPPVGVQQHRRSPVIRKVATLVVRRHSTQQVSRLLYHAVRKRRQPFFPYNSVSRTQSSRAIKERKNVEIPTFTITFC